MMRCYCCNTVRPRDQFRVHVGGEWVPCGICRQCIEYAKVYARQRARGQGRAPLKRRTETKQERYAA